MNNKKSEISLASLLRNQNKSNNKLRKITSRMIAKSITSKKLLSSESRKNDSEQADLVEPN